MENNANLFESLVEKATDYGKISYELVKLKALDKTSDVVSSVVPHSLAFILFASFMLFLNLGLALWLGELLDRVYWGFFIVAAFYGCCGLIVHFFMHKKLKNIVGNYIIKHMLK